MSPPPAERERKRQRPLNPRTTDEEDHVHTDEEARHGSDDLAPRPGQAERKRELERNRRNLVNVRFVELEAELRRCVPRPDPPDRMTDSPAPAKGKRIDKEAVLKDAAQRLAVQRKDLTSAAERMKSMAAEIENLRAEKVELRDDKAYLRSELETVRGDLNRLRTDNINLWQAFRKASSFKDSFAADVAKLPAELFFRTEAEPLSVAALGNTMVQQQATLPPGHGIPHQSSAQSLLSQQQPIQPPQPPSSQPSPTPNPLQQVQQQLLNQQRQSQHHQRQQQQSGSPLLSGDQSREMATSVPTGISPQISGGLRSSAMNTDSFLILQSPEELGELFNNYVPGSMIPNFPPSSGQRVEATQQVNSRGENIQAGAATSSSPQLTSYGRVQIPQSVQSPVKAEQRSNAAFGSLNIGSGNNMARTGSDKEGAEPPSDVAYCV